MPENMSTPSPVDSFDYRGYLLEPFGPIGIISHTSNEAFVRQVNDILYEKRLLKQQKNYSPYVNSAGYLRRDFTISATITRFQTGEGKVTINQTVRGHDIYIISDVLNHEESFSLSGAKHYTSPDDHFRDLLRIIMAVSGKARRINVIMPFLYEGRQDHCITRESLDCAQMLKDLYNLGVANLIVFDPHDPRIINAVPLMGIEMPKSAYKIIHTLISKNPGLHIDKDNMMIISPDETAVSRAIFYSSMLELPLGLFYRDRDYTKVDSEGNHPIKSFRFLGDDPKGKDVLIVDDMINSGNTMIRTARYMHERGAGNIFCAAPFGLFTDGLEPFNKAHEEGIIKQVYCTNLTYRPKELFETPWYVDVNMTPFVARLIDALNVDESIGQLISPIEKFNSLLGQVRIEELMG
ncbi:MAG: ribose-phosphate diphosphokinase [Clostridiales bacterium]|nr:ribose-phosphate diphosphokinase [Clostridiales bacterium]MBQ4184844.1 ribose-phosphate diphosphokinase [Clostridiales bacterium]MBQ6270343.1 ribose-phosphate diphosphokinase [Clostridiales bacterium]MBR4009348.1 ribose-phosphate diphosphokinase [Clostridiales bacterium]MCR5058507.1 ribose-phosphate diphosphokinase [Clostridiales bacterium]